MESSLAAEDRLTRLETELDRLKNLYDQYFAGVTRVQPTKEADDFARDIRNFKVTDLVSTSQKFRFANTKSRYQQLRTHWEKICQQIEEGSFIREKSLNRLRSHPGDESSSNKEKSRSSGIDDKELRSLETLYQKLQQTKKDNKVMAKDKFISAMKKQLEVFRSKNPNSIPQFRLTKDPSGKTQVKIEKKAPR